MIRPLTLSLIGLTFALPAMAQDGTVDAALAKAPDVAATVINHEDTMARTTALMALCPLALRDPQAVMAIMEGAGWNPIEGGSDTIGYDRDGSMNPMITIGINGGYCDVMTESATTADLSKNFFDSMDAIGWPAFDWTGDEGCIEAKLDAGITAAISGFNACPATDGAVIVFEGQ